MTCDAGAVIAKAIIRKKKTKSKDAGAIAAGEEKWRKKGSREGSSGYVAGDAGHRDDRDDGPLFYGNEGHNCRSSGKSHQQPLDAVTSKKDRFTLARKQGVSRTADV